jgi:hypothetical protein
MFTRILARKFEARRLELRQVVFRQIGGALDDRL